MSRMRDILNKYYKISGQEVNMAKSSLIFRANATGRVKKDICSMLSIPYNAKPGKYMGLSIEWGRTKSEALGLPKDWMRQKP